LDTLEGGTLDRGVKRRPVSRTRSRLDRVPDKQGAQGADSASAQGLELRRRWLVDRNDSKECAGNGDGRGRGKRKQDEGGDDCRCGDRTAGTQS
jgi:hypothetical protein